MRKSRKDLLGRRYSIYPVVMIREGTFYPDIGSNTRCSVHFEASELRKTTIGWNGRPAVLNHPSKDESGNDPEVLNRMWLGYIFNTSFDESRAALTSDLWLAEDRNAGVINKINSGVSIDVSIGAYADFNGTSHESTATNIVPDHLAILPDSTGACGWNAGCGIRAVNTLNINNKSHSTKGGLMFKPFSLEGKITGLSSLAHIPSYEGVESTPWEDVDKSLEAYVSAYNKTRNTEDRDGDGGEVVGEIITHVKDLSQDAKEWIASKTILGNPDSDKYVDLVVFPVVNPKTDKLNMGALRAVLSGRGAQADIPKLALEEARSIAEKLLDEYVPRGQKITDNGDNIMVDAVDAVHIEKTTNTNYADAGKNSDGDQRHVDETIACSSTAGSSLKDFLASAPIELRETLSDAVYMREAARGKLISNILSCKKVSFKGEFLDGAGTESLESISKLVDLTNNSVDKTINLKERNSDFSLKATSVSQKGKNIPMTKIDWATNNTIK